MAKKEKEEEYKKGGHAKEHKAKGGKVEKMEEKGVKMKKGGKVEKGSKEVHLHIHHHTGK